MGLSSKGSVVTLWDIKPSEKSTKCKVTVSQKDKKTNTWETQFNSFALFAGQAHNFISGMKEKDRVKITQFDISNKYDKEKKITYWNLTVWECEDANSPNQGSDLPFA